MQTKTRKRKSIDTKPLEEPMIILDTLTIPEKHDLHSLIIEVVYVSDENGDFGIWWSAAIGVVFANYKTNQYKHDIGRLVL
ncbi:MAG: hypothetical protein E7494_13665 [Ruminococcus albus]|jgi:hypothetical protein|nr:hypothetical protein [Ruminococcus albus]